MHSNVFTCLRINFDKSIVVPINTNYDKMHILANTLGCSIVCFSFTYPGLPLSLYKPKMEDFVPVLKRRRLFGYSTLPFRGENLTLIKYVLTILPTSYMSILVIPVGILE